MHYQAKMCVKICGRDTKTSSITMGYILDLHLAFPLCSCDEWTYKTYSRRHRYYA